MKPNFHIFLIFFYVFFDSNQDYFLFLYNKNNILIQNKFNKTVCLILQQTQQNMKFICHISKYMLSFKALFTEIIAIS